MSKSQIGPWRFVLTYAIGGLTEIGFSSGEDYILILSSSGRSVISLASREIIARDHEQPSYNADWIDLLQKAVRGIDILCDEWIQVVGLWGGSLNTHCSTGWSVNVRYEDQTEFAYIAQKESNIDVFIDKPITEIRAFGFSNTGRFLVLATGSDLSLYEYIK
ncbi:MAG: hypothetical protein H7Y59_19335 [Anaerolineales bacterium]|nr:hypothetical protein [Anaerolineales bacterium]